MKRAYSLLRVKSIDAEQRILTGIATTPAPDRAGDIVESDGAQFQLPIPLLWQHNSREPIGEVFAAHVTSEGIEIQARIVTIDEPGPLQDRINDAWQSLKAGLVKGLSIGFQSIEEALLTDTYAYRYIKWLWLELSCVTIPANADATILNLKSHDIGLAAPGPRFRVVHLMKSGASDISRAGTPARTSRTMKKPISEQITDFEATRAAKDARRTEIQSKASEDGRTKDAAEKEEFDTLRDEIKAIDEELVDLREMEVANKAAAKPIKAETPEKASASRAGHVITIERTLPKGFLFARYAMCMANSRGIPGEAIRLAKEHYKDDPGVLALVEKTAVAGASTTGTHWLADMVPYNVMADFIEFQRAGSIIGKFGSPIPGAPGRNYPSLRRVGFNERVSGMSTGFTAGWKGEGLPALPSAAVTFNMALLFNCMSALAVLTKESVRFSNPNAETEVRRELAAAVNGKLDLDFVDPAKAASGTTSPASITYGIAATAPSGTGATNIRHDLAAILGQFTTNKLNPSDIVLIMSATQAAQIAMMVNALGQMDFPTLTMEGGYLLGYPVIVSEHLTSVGSPSTQTIIAVKASDVYLADDGVVTVEASDQASIEMVDTSNQSAISGTGASLVSLWQTGAIGLMANREITWKLRRSTAVQYISPAAYVVPTS